MSALSEMDSTIKDLRTAASLINEAASWLEQQFGTPAEPASKPEEKPVIKLEDVRAVLATASRNGYSAQVRELLAQYGADKLSAVDPANYEALLADAEGMFHAG